MTTVAFTPKACAVSSCDTRSWARGWCKTHWQRWSRWGSVDGCAPVQSPAERFFEKVQFTDTCWLWTATLNDRGYPQFWDGDKLVYAHRWLYEFCVGPIPDGFTLDHLCETPSCVRPDDVEPVTNAVNNARKWERHPVTHCPDGHLYTRWNNRGTGYCMPCINARNARKTKAG